MKINMNEFYNAFNYPFGFINCSITTDYRTEDFTVIMFDDNFKSENINIKSINLSKDIIEVYWYEKGKNDYKPWEFVGKIKCEDKHYYVYYIANCDYTGFDCQGDMKMYISEHLSRILKHAVPTKLHNYISDSTKQL